MRHLPSHYFFIQYFSWKMYHIDARKLALQLYSHLQSLRKVARLIGISHSSIQRWAQRLERKPYSQRCKPKYDTLVSIVKLAIASDPFVSIRTLQRQVKETCDVRLSTELVRVALKRLGFSKKKARHVCRPSHLPARTAAFLKMREMYKSQGRAFVSTKHLLVAMVLTHGATRRWESGCTFQATPLERRPCRMSYALMKAE
jgi:transposase